MRRRTLNFMFNIGRFLKNVTNYNRFLPFPFTLTQFAILKLRRINSPDFFVSFYVIYKSWLKGTVPRDFRPSVFFIKTSVLAP
jgi:hypothetical protein